MNENRQTMEQENLFSLENKIKPMPIVESLLSNIEQLCVLRFQAMPSSQCLTEQSERQYVDALCYVTCNVLHCEVLRTQWTSSDYPLLWQPE